MREPFALSAQQLGIRAGHRQLFRDISFTVANQQFWQVTGDNGSGKTTLLRILVGLTTAESGQVLWQSLPLRSQREEYWSRLLYLGHQSGIKHKLNALENLQFYHPIAEEAIWQALEQVGLIDQALLPVYQLSAGQQRRVALARLWLTDTDLWILDEPFTALDKHYITSLGDRLEQHVAQGGSVLFTSHQPFISHQQKINGIELSAKVTPC